MCRIYGNETGAVLSVGLIVLAVLAFLGAVAVTMTTTDVLISGNYKDMVQTFHASEAGTEEGRARLRANATNPINDPDSASAAWRVYIGSEANALAHGYVSNSVDHVLTASNQNDLDYVVEIEHAIDGGGNVLYWGDHDNNSIKTRNTSGVSSQNIYTITSYLAATSDKAVEVEAVRVPPVVVPAALYVEAETTVMGTSTYVIGTNGGPDQDPACTGADVPGIATTLAEPNGNGNGNGNGNNAEPVDQNGNPHIEGTPAIQYSTQDLDIQAMIDDFKDLADFSYAGSSMHHTGNASPGPADNWGAPTSANGADQYDPTSCNETNIVHYDTGGTYAKLTGGVTGCGILLVEGDLEIHGNFGWYGAVIVSGSIIFSGGGNKNITGAILSGGSAIADVIGGNANIIFCRDALTNQTQNRALLVLNWKEL